MNQRMMVQLEIIKNERTFTFAIPVGTPYEDAYEVSKEITEMLREAAEKAKEAAAKQQETTEEKVS